MTPKLPPESTYTREQVIEAAQAVGVPDLWLACLTDLAFEHLGKMLHQSTLAALAQQAQEPIGEIMRSFSDCSGLNVRLYGNLTSDTPGIVGAKLYTTPQVPVCPRCDGSGTVTEMSDNSPYAHEVDVACQHCNGSGALDDAYTGVVALLKRATENYHRALPYMVKVQNEAAGLPPPQVPAPVDERESFEAWFLETQGIEARHHQQGGYVLNAANMLWSAWQARAALQSTAPQTKGQP